MSDAVKEITGQVVGVALIVLVESLDRLSRDLEHVAALYKRITFRGARIVTLSEGVVTDMHVGLRGTMASLFLKDLAAKTHRGLEGRIRQGRATGNPPYRYRVEHRLDHRGEPERGLRRIEEAEAAVVRRIFTLYAGGTSPMRIARLLNAEGVPRPNGGAWLEDTIRGRIGRQDGILRNPPANPGDPPGITLEGNLPAMLALAGIGTRPKTETSGATAFDREVDCSVKRDPGAWMPLYRTLSSPFSR
jgi:hypothetical protein